ncbi:MAG: amidohydrolase family protein [Gemmatimonadaceae bacterium]
MGVRHVAVLACLTFFASNAWSQPTGVVAITGATVIDGTGASAIADATIVIRGARIAAVGPRARVTVPNGARIIDGTGKFVTPGFVDSNVHVSIYSGLENFARYQDRFGDVALEAAQLHLKHGVTTIRDSYGMLSALKAAREAIRAGQVVGPRMYIAGNIVGWGGPWSLTFSGRPPENLSLLQEQMNDAITEGSGEELVHMEPDSLRIAINAYLDKGVDFLKYGGTSHFGGPIQIGFSDRAQKVIVDAVHARGKIAETHSTTPEGLRMSLLAGVDLVQHPEVLDVPMSDELADMFVERKVVCAMLANTITGQPWQTHVRQKTRDDSARKVRSDSALTQGWRRERTSAERARDRGNIGMEMRRRNAEKLIKHGCIVSIATDNYLGLAPEFRRDPKPAWQDAGSGTLSAIEGLVELGMTPMQAIVAATKNGAIASHAEKEYGTIEVGKAADIALLDADPLADIKNIRKLSLVIANGVVVDPKTLPTKPVWSRR